MSVNVETTSLGLKDRRTARYYLVATALTLLATLITYLLARKNLEVFSGFFITAVATSAWLGGARCGLLSLTGSLVAEALLREPVGSLQVSGRNHLAAILVFLLNSFVILLLVDSLYLSRRRSIELDQELRETRRIAKKVTKGGWWEYDLWREEVVAEPADQPPLPPSPYEEWVQQVRPEDRTYLRGQIVRAIREGLYEADYRVVSPDSKSVKGIGSVIYRSEGIADRIIAITLDADDFGPTGC